MITHPDLFTEAEAVVYTKVTSPRGLRTLREVHGLVGQRLGKKFVYHRAHLDACINRVYGISDAKGKVKQ